MARQGAHWRTLHDNMSEDSGESIEGSAPAIETVEMSVVAPLAPEVLFEAVESNRQ